MSYLTIGIFKHGKFTTQKSIKSMSLPVMVISYNKDINFMFVFSYTLPIASGLKLDNSPEQDDKSTMR
jgi:hypothetical protein